MKYVKPKISKKDLEKIITNNFNIPFDNLKEIPEGEIAKTYSFNIGESKYFIQFNQANMSGGTKKELEYFDRLKALNIPMRIVVKRDAINGIHYAITEKVKGKRLQELSETEVKELLPYIFDALINISKMDIKNTTGYGWFSSGGNGWFSTWRDHINFVMEEEPDELFYGKWYDLFETTFLNKKTYELYYQKMKELFKYLPEDRYFMHGNFSYSNILVHNKKISAIIDWQDSRYGDFLLDFTYFVFWVSDSFGNYIIESFKQYLELKNMKTEFYYERIKCYKYYFGLDALRFYAKTDQKESYDYALKLLEKIG